MFESGLNSQWKITLKKNGRKEISPGVCIDFIKMVKETGFYLLINAEFRLKLIIDVLHKSICLLANQLE